MFGGFGVGHERIVAAIEGVGVDSEARIPNTTSGLEGLVPRGFVEAVTLPELVVAT